MPQFRPGITVALAGLMALAGCAGSGSSASGGKRSLKPSDFTTQSAAAQASAPGGADAAGDAAALDIVSDRSAGQAGGGSPEAAGTRPGTALTTVAPAPAGAAPLAGGAAATAATTASADDAADKDYTLDAMIGQVNGRPVYASRVLAPIQEQLTALGQRWPRSVFRQKAEDLIVGRLISIITDQLMLGEAQRDLSAEEEGALQGYLKNQREELLRKYGQGSPALADQTLRNDEGISLQGKIEEFRQRVLVERYMRRKLLPKLNVSKKDIERYYNDHSEQFNSPPQRTLRVIRVKDPAAAAAIAKRLADGESFAGVAHDPANQYRAGDGGLWPEKVKGDSVFGAEVDKAMAALQAGAHTPRVDVDSVAWWVFVETLEPGKHQSLTDVQMQIERDLRERQFRSLTQDYRDQLFRTGSYNSVKDMTGALVNIALARYALSE